jgi:oligopeptide transport system permease protein
MAENNSSNTNASTTIASLNELTSPPRSLLKDAWFRLIRNKGAVVAMVIIVIFILGALFADKLVPHNPLEMNSGKDFLPPVWVERGPTGEAGQKEFIFGTDTLGRDVLSRTIYGARVSMVVGVIPTALILLIGIFVGLYSGYTGGTVDNLLMRFTDVIYAFPDLLFFIIVMISLRDTYRAITEWLVPALCRPGCCQLGWRGAYCTRTGSLIEGKRIC